MLNLNYKLTFLGESTRFSKPTPAKAWTGVYNATSPGNNCVQFGGAEFIQNVTSSEDCLFLNVWKPIAIKKNGVTNSPTTTAVPPSVKYLPVMVWIYGGAFESGGIFGNPPFYDGRYIAALGEVIVVSFNYRLGPLGFLTDGKSVSNLALHDQILALKWVQENIGSFGGDPKLVTIFGESAGAISVGALVLSPLAKDLFRRAIAQSGAPLGAVVESKEQSFARTKAFGKKVNCTVDTEIVKCLQTKSIDNLKKETFLDFSTNNFFIPVHGDDVLPVPPSIALKENKLNHVDFIYGKNRV